MPEQHQPFDLPLGAGRADVILVQHLQHAGSRDAGDQRHEDGGERQRRQGDVVDEAAQIDEGADIALHRKPAQVERQSEDQEIAHDEDRH